jgi:hypothetical protein
VVVRESVFSQRLQLSAPLGAWEPPVFQDEDDAPPNVESPRS